MKPITKRTILSAVAILLAAPVAWASHPELGQMERVQLLAHEVEATARHAHREAERRAHHGDHGEEWALAALHRLESQARHFHREVEKYDRNPAHTEDDFFRLVDAYEDALWGFRFMHAEAHVRRDFSRLRRAMDQLIGYYGGDGRGYGGGRGHGYGGHGYGGHGRYDDHGDDRYGRRPLAYRTRPNRY